MTTELLAACQAELMAQGIRHTFVCDSGQAPCLVVQREDVEQPPCIKIAGGKLLLQLYLGANYLCATPDEVLAHLQTIGIGEAA